MVLVKETQDKPKNRVPLVFYVFFGSSIGAVIGLLTYVNGWL